MGHLTRKNPSPCDLYCVGGTLSLTQSINLTEPVVCLSVCVVQGAEVMSERGGAVVSGLTGALVHWLVPGAWWSVMRYIAVVGHWPARRRHCEPRPLVRSIDSTAVCVCVCLGGGSNCQSFNGSDIVNV